MKVAITGHTSGIGLSLSQQFTDRGYEVLGFSRSNNFDIGDPARRAEIIEQIKDCDVFINNAYHETGQLELLKEVINNWNGQYKDIINISSVIVLMPDGRFTGWPKVLEYKHSKELLNKFATSYKGTIRMLNVLPGIVKTNFHLIEENPEAMTHAMEVTFVTDRILKDFLTDTYNRKQIVITTATEGL